MNKEILLTITMLVSNREETIEKCMKSLKHLMDTVPSELIVVDTAGNETCMEIVRQYTDKIVKFTWCNDFAAARNAGVYQAQGCWLMYLDDDEWFESTEELEAFFLSGEFRNYNAASYIVRNYTERDGSRWKDTSVGRLVKRGKETCFQGKIHEYLYPVKQPVRFLNDYVHHYGYIFESNQKKIEHSWRNIKPLLEMLRENPKDYHTTTQLIQEYVTAEEYFSAIELAKETREGADCWDMHRERYTSYAAVTEMKLYIRQKRYWDGYQTGKEILGDKKISVLAKGCIYNQMVGCCFQLEKYEEAILYIELFKKGLKEWEAYPKKQWLDCLAVSEDYLVPEELMRLTFLCLHIDVLQKEWEKAGKVMLSVNWEADRLRMLTDTGEDVISTLEKADFNEKYVIALEHIKMQEEFEKALYTEVDKAEGEESLKLMRYFSLLPPENINICKYHLIYAGVQNDRQSAALTLEKMKEEHYPLFLIDERYWNSLLKLNIDINEYTDNISIYDWMELTRRLWQCLDEKACETVYLCLTKRIEKKDIRYIYISALWQEKQLAGRKEEMTEPEEVWAALYHLAQYWVSCAASLYREDVFMGDLIGAIPPAYQFGWYILQAKAVKEQDCHLFIRKIADAAKVYPAMKELCKKVMQGTVDKSE